MNAAEFTLRAAHVAVAALAAAIAERAGTPPPSWDRSTLDQYVARWNDVGQATFEPRAGRRNKREVLTAFDEAIVQLERALSETGRDG